MLRRVGLSGRVSADGQQSGFSSRILKRHILLQLLPLHPPPPYLNLHLMPLLSALVRSAILSDAPALAALGRTTFVQTFMEDFAIPYPPADIAAYLNTNYTEDAVRVMLRESGAMTWVAEKDGVMLAFANAGPNTLPSVFCTMKRSSAC